jgi:TolB-like protein/DNA-binding winged helix-turn-helix (wHTH) protein/Tfp pilus assembly protein PilF
LVEAGSIAITLTWRLAPDDLLDFRCRADIGKEGKVLTSEASDDTARWILFDGVGIDLTGRRLFVDGRESPIEPKAFAVLALLAREPGRAFARDDILDAVWGHRHVTPGVLNRIITLLRHALGEQAHNAQYLKTVHGVGYRFDLPPPARNERATAAQADAASEPLSAEPQVGAPVATTIDATGEIAPAEAVPAILPPASQPLSASRSRSRWIACALLLPLLIAAGWWLWQRAAPDETPVSVKKQGVAVLPMVNATGDASQQSFADGISESLISTLSQYEGLRVIGRTAAFRFRDNKDKAVDVGAKLGVAHLVEGSVQRDGDVVRVAIELIRSTDGSTVWSQRFDRPYKDLFALQDEISLAVAGALQVKLLHARPSMIASGRPDSGNLEAYDAYLRGTYDMQVNLAKSIEEFELATRLDPGYAQAWTWLALTRTIYAGDHLQGDAARAGLAQAHTEVDTALGLRPNYGQAHAIRANLLRIADHDWNGSLAEFRIALPLVPDNDPSHGAYSILLTSLGKIRQAITERQKYIDGDPLSGFAHMYLSDLQSSLGRLDEAQASLREAERLVPKNTNSYADQASYLAVLRGDADAAASAAKRIAIGHRRDQVLALALQIAGDRDAADAALQRLLDVAGQAKDDAYVIARIYALRNDADNAFAWLQRDRERGGNGVQYVLFSPLILRLRNDPRLAAYCRQAGLPPPSQSEALSLDQIRARLALQR